MRSAPGWFIQNFAREGIDLNDPGVQQELNIIWWIRADGKKLLHTLDGGSLTTHGAKVMQKRRAAARVARRTRRSQQRAAAVLRRKRQRRARLRP